MPRLIFLCLFRFFLSVLFLHTQEKMPKEADNHAIDSFVGVIRYEFPNTNEMSVVVR